MSSARYSYDLTYWWRVLNTAVVPEIVLAAFDLQRAIRSHVALKDLRVVATCLMML